MHSLVTVFGIGGRPVLPDVPEARRSPFPNPFEERRPTGLALAAGEALLAELRRGRVADDTESAALDEPGSGRMFGVLAVETPCGQLGFLRGFSGKHGDRWNVRGFVPPLFDVAERERIERDGQADIDALDASLQALARSEELATARSAAEEFEGRYTCESDALRANHIENRRLRREQRRAGTADAALLEKLARRSCADKTERRRLKERTLRERSQVLGPLVKLERRLAAFERLRDYLLRRTQRRVHAAYRVANARGETRELRDLYGKRFPPSGAGDCAAPKLLGYAHANGLRPIALAEFWFGAAPLAGGRMSGVYYRACRTKCGPLLPFMLEGVEVESLEPYSPPATNRLDIRVVFEDERLVVIDKPSGLLSVPSSNVKITDSATVRLRALKPSVEGPLFVHRLDMDTSGLLIAAMDPQAHANLQRQFATRRIEKRYVAWLEGEVEGDEGTIDLAVRGDRDDRPRQIHDPVNGKRAVTHWRVIERRAGRTRIELRPVTGRTHQLRIHAAHHLGLGAPIVGDNLYGRGGERLMLHAEMLRLRHPGSNEFVTIESPAPF